MEANSLYRYVSLTLLIIFYSCIQSCSPEDGVETLIINDKSSKDIFKLSKICSSIEYVQLDTSQNAFFKQTADILIRDSLMFVLDSENGCYAFNVNTGKKLFEINNIGRGPMEMAYPQALYVDLIRGRVEMFDSRKRKLFIYNLEGDFLKHISSKGLLFIAFTKNGNNKYVLYTGNHINSSNGNSIKKSVLYTDSVFNITNSMFELTLAQSRYQFSSNNVFPIIDNNLHFINFPDGHLYDLSAKEPRSMLRIDFDKYNLPASLVNNEKGYNTTEWINHVRDRGYSAGISATTRTSVIN